MVGRRVPDETERFARGDYGRLKGRWMACTPKGSLGDLSEHTVTEHADGTITVSPSILVTTYDADETVLWHGYLEHGVWREC